MLRPEVEDVLGPVGTSASKFRNPLDAAAEIGPTYQCAGARGACLPDIGKISACTMTKHRLVLQKPAKRALPSRMSRFPG